MSFLVIDGTRHCQEYQTFFLKKALKWREFIDLNKSLINFFFTVALYFARDFSLEIRFCVILQGIQNFYVSDTPRILAGPWFSYPFFIDDFGAEFYAA